MISPPDYRFVTYSEIGLEQSGPAPRFLNVDRIVLCHESWVSSQWLCRDHR
jgi:hypothetical protein